MNSIQTVVKAEIIHLKHQILALQTLRPKETFATKDVSGSVTVIADAIYGRKLNHTYGLGMFGPVTEDDLHIVELAYETSGLAPELDMCEYAEASVFDLLSAEYKVTGSLCEFQLDLTNYECRSTSNGDIEVSTSAFDHDAYVQASVEGFRDMGRPESLLKTLAESAIARSDTTLFFASIKGELVATAAMAIVDVDDSKIAILYKDSCLPHARGKGAHAAMLRKRIEAAKSEGCHSVISAAREGSGSARNMQRAGLEPVYSYKTYTKCR